MKRSSIVLFISLPILILFGACATNKQPISPAISNLPVETKGETPEKPLEKKPTEEEILENKAETLLKSMTLDEKIGQLFLISVRNSYNGSRMVTADSYMKKIINTYHPGGLILFTVNFENPIQTRDLIRGTQAISRIPLFMAVDEEGGKVARLGNTERMSVTKLPPAAEIGKTGNTENAEEATRIISGELKAFGFNMNMAPVADVNTNSRNPVIGDRTYSDDPRKAGAMVAAVVRTMKEENMISVLKHFPGHGDTSGDTHKGTVVLRQNLDRLENVEFVPFRMGIEAGADFVMTAHIEVPLVTGNDLPATMSPLFLHDILREEMGFKGVIITDAMDMGAIKNNWPAGKAAVNALKAGADMILMPANLGAAVSAVKDALENGVLSEKDIDDSVRRILKVKIRHNLFDETPPGSNDILGLIGTEEHREAIDALIHRKN